MFFMYILFLVFPLEKRCTCAPGGGGPQDGDVSAGRDQRSGPELPPPGHHPHGSTERPTSGNLTSVEVNEVFLTCLGHMKHSVFLTLCTDLQPSQRWWTPSAGHI